jgi:hypothetical protein
VIDMNNLGICGRFWLYLLYPEDKGYNVVGEVCPVTEGFKFLEIVLAVA